ncbi:signal transduction histidine kinase [Catenulispora sp. GP43]|uniref:sensor histidine kinase n=1 Tax=Catenulispora sp. GP43 TaxID=3156263 RepID=UPI003511F4A7
MPAEPRPPLLHRVRPRQWDGLALACALVFGLVTWGTLAHQRLAVAVVAIGTLLVVIPIVIGRRTPVAAFALFPVAVALPVGTMALAGLAVAPAAYVLYLAAASRGARTRAALLACGTVLPFLAPLTTGVHKAGASFPSAMLLVTAWTVGYAIGERRRYTAQVVRYHAGLAQASAQKAGREAAEERMRIARELHDVVAHSMSLITVQAGYGRLVAGSEPEEAAAALATIEDAGRAALTEMRRLLGVLREENPEAASLAPAPGLAALPTLAEQTARAGVRVSLIVEGEERQLAAGIELAAYRIVQEALTNVVRHSGAPSAVVGVTYEPDALTLEISDRGSGCDLSQAPTGHGIVGMRERAAMYEGWFRAGPRPDGGFRVMTRLPLRPAPDTATNATNFTNAASTA